MPLCRMATDIDKTGSHLPLIGHTREHGGCGWAAPISLGTRCARTSQYSRSGGQPLTKVADGRLRFFQEGRRLHCETASPYLRVPRCALGASEKFSPHT